MGVAVHASQSAPFLTRRHHPLHDDCGQIGIGVAGGGQFPIQNGGDFGLVLVEQHVVDAVIAMHQRALAILGGDVGIQPSNQFFHRRDVIGFRRPVLFGPAVDLAAVIITFGAIIRQARSVQINIVDRGQNPVHFVLNGAAVIAGQFVQAGIVKMASLHLVHDIEGGPDDRVILTQQIHFGDGNIAALQGALDAEFAVNGMGRFQQHPRRLAAQHIVAGGGDQPERGIGLPHVEFFGAQRASETVQMGA